MSEHQIVGVGGADSARVAGGVGGRERTIEHGLSDGGACGAVSGHQCPGRTARSNIPADRTVH